MINEPEGVCKINPGYLDTLSNDTCIHYFGNWVHNIEKLNSQFINARPFEHVVIDNFLACDYAEKLFNEFPVVNESWHEYKNPIEVKYTYDNINILTTELKNYFYYLSTPEITRIFKQLTNIDNLEYDEYLHGAGLHAHPRNGRLNIHLDYEKHPYSGKERRLNIILFITKDWDPLWNGANELWDKDVTECITKTDVKFNRAILFKTNDISWHGLPEKIACPTHIYRQSLAYYYVAPLNTQKHENDYRKKAKFVKRPVDNYDPNIQKLYDIRPYRRITTHDLETIVPDWTVEL
jgi:hypothetical protein